MRYTDQVNFRVAAEFRDQLREAAEAEGVSVGEFLRRAALERAASVGAKTGAAA